MAANVELVLLAATVCALLASGAAVDTSSIVAVCATPSGLDCGTGFVLRTDTCTAWRHLHRGAHREAPLVVTSTTAAVVASRFTTGSDSTTVLLPGEPGAFTATLVGLDWLTGVAVLQLQCGLGGEEADSVACPLVDGLDVASGSHVEGTHVSVLTSGEPDASGQLRVSRVRASVAVSSVPMPVEQRHAPWGASTEVDDTSDAVSQLEPPRWAHRLRLDGADDAREAAIDGRAQASAGDGSGRAPSHGVVVDTDGAVAGVLWGACSAGGVQPMCTCASSTAIAAGLASIAVEDTPRLVACVETESSLLGRRSLPGLRASGAVLAQVIAAARLHGNRYIAVRNADNGAVRAVTGAVLARGVAAATASSPGDTCGGAEGSAFAVYAREVRAVPGDAKSCPHAPVVAAASVAASLSAEERAARGARHTGSRGSAGRQAARTLIARAAAAASAASSLAVHDALAWHETAGESPCSCDGVDVCDIQLDALRADLAAAHATGFTFKLRFAVAVGAVVLAMVAAGYTVFRVKRRLKTASKWANTLAQDMVAMREQRDAATATINALRQALDKARQQLADRVDHEAGTVSGRPQPSTDDGEAQLEGQHE